MLSRFNKYIYNNKLFTNTDAILVGASGGIDSMVLVDLCIKAGYKIAIAHCNFNLRGIESDNDEAFVKKYAEDNQILFYNIRFNTTEYADEHGISIQMAARDLRYNWFNKLIRQHKLAAIAVAHHADDVIETFLLNLSRGAGLNGLCGMPVKNGHIVRPLLFATRDEIIGYAKLNVIEYREDASNASIKYARNRIRHNVIPEMTEVNPHFKNSALQAINYLNDIRVYLNNHLNLLSDNICVTKDNIVTITINELVKFPQIDLLLFHILNKYGFKNQMIANIHNAILSNDTGQQFNSQTHTLIKNRDTFLITPKNEEGINEYIIQENDCLMTLPNLSLKIDGKPYKHNFEIIKNKSIAQLDYDTLQFPLVIRKWNKGDSFYPIGMKGKKKLSDYFIEKKYSLFDKQNQWLLTSNNEIVWVIGQRIDDRFKVTEQTKQVYQLIIL